MTASPNIRYHPAEIRNAPPGVQSIRVACHAKVNLWLEIIRRRDDGFHEISSRIAPLELHDDLEITLAHNDQDLLLCQRPDVPLDRSNLIWKAVDLFRQHTSFHEPLHIRLNKRIPIGAGLGGGSSNAAATLRALNDLNAEPLNTEKLHTIAAKIGSDVPFFLGFTVYDVSGRGEILTPVHDWNWRLPILLIKPAFPVSTPWAYQKWAESTGLHSAPKASQLTPWGLMKNDLESPVFEKYTLLADIKRWLLRDPGITTSLMSGSGATIFAITRSEGDALRLQRRAIERYGPTTWTCITHTRR